MSKRINWYAKLGLGVVLLAAVTVGCSTRRYVRDQVSARSTELPARMDDQQSGIEANANQINELGGVTREQSEEIGSLGRGLEATD